MQLLPGKIENIKFTLTGGSWRGSAAAHACSGIITNVSPNLGSMLVYRKSLECETIESLFIIINFLW